MTPVSFTGIGAIVVIVEAIFKMFGFDFPDGTVSAALNGLVTFIGFVLLIIGQLRRKDLHFGLIRKS